MEKPKNISLNHDLELQRWELNIDDQQLLLSASELQDLVKAVCYTSIISNVPFSFSYRHEPSHTTTIGTANPNDCDVLNTMKFVANKDF